MRISSTLFTNNFLIQVNQLQQRQNTLQMQAATGLSFSLPEDNPAGMAAALNLQTTSSSQNQYQTNISRLQTAATTSYTVINSLQTISSQASEIATSASSGITSPQQLASYAAQVAQLIQEAIQLGNTQDANGNYIFGGTMTNVKPFVPTSDSDGNVTAVTYQGNTDESQSEIAPGVTVSTQVPGANTTGSGPHGLFTDSRYDADIFSHLISLQQHLAAGDTSAISSTDVPALAKDGDNITTAVGENAVVQSTLTHANTLASTQSTNTVTQISNLTNADLAQTLTQLQQTQTAYQAALESGSMVFSISLLNYLQ